MKFIKKIGYEFDSAQRKWQSPEPVRPVVLIQSDDWGRVGVPDAGALDSLQDAGVPVGNSAWDYYGAESEDDLARLGDTLSRHVDADGNPACMTANVVMANADLRRMIDDDFSGFRFVSIKEGFPPPWEKFDLVAAYGKLMAKGVFYPALHGFTHFSAEMMLAGWHEKGEFGERVRSLIRRDIPYLASLTPEYNFALMLRHADGEKFAGEEEQRHWIEMGIRLFRDCFGFLPLSTCAPGYRANQATYRLWSESGIRVAQTASMGVAYEENGLFFIPRTVFFEPALSARRDDAVAMALEQAASAVKQGKMIVICSHSINYIERHLSRREESLASLDALLTGLLRMFPDLRFASDEKVFSAWSNKDEGWFASPSLQTRAKRYLA